MTPEFINSHFINLNDYRIPTCDCDSSKPETCNVSKEQYDSIALNNTYLPDVKRVIYNLKTEKTVTNRKGEKTIVKLDDPIMTTTVLFSDNTSVTVQNSVEDAKVRLEDVKVGDTVVQTASRADKETGLVYALVKRLACVPGKNGKCSGGFGKILSELVDKAYDQPVEEARTVVERKMKKIAFEKEKKERANQPKRYTVNEVLQILGPYLEKLTRNEADPKTVLLSEAGKKPAGKKPKKPADK